MSVTLCLNGVTLWWSSANTELFTIQKKTINCKCKDKLLVGNYFRNYIYIYIHVFCNFVSVGHAAGNTPLRGPLCGSATNATQTRKWLVGHA
jgi:hypothetical protein